MKEAVITVPEERLRARQLRQRYGDLVLLGLIALLLPLLALLAIPLARIVLGLAVALLAPGYVLQAALFPGRHDADGIMRAALSFGLSIMVLPLLALVLDRLPWGLQRGAIFGALSLWIGVVCIVAAVRRHFVKTVGTDASFEPEITGGWWSSLPRPRQAGYLVVLVTATSMILWGLVTLHTYAFSANTTEFYAVSAEGLAEGYPREVAPGEVMRLKLGITNHEGKALQYRVEVHSSTARLAAMGPISVNDGATWEQLLSYALPAAGNDQRIEIQLFRGQAAPVYRHLQLWVNVRAKQP